MLLPNGDRAIIEPRKIRDYLLSDSHPVGRFKARVFARLGFTAERWELFEQALREQHLNQPAESAGGDAFGQSFTISAILKGPTGAPAPIVSVWFIRVGEDRPRFVTAYPGGTL